MAKVKYGFIGAGSIARWRHLNECAKINGAEIAAICDIDKKRAQERAEEFGGTVYTDYKKMLKDADIDAVIVSTPNKLHAPMTIAAFKAGKHVLVEKPMATTRLEAKKMIEAAKAARKYLMVGQNQRLMPPHVRAKEILKSGRIGKVVSFRSEFQHPGPEGWSIDGAKSWFFKKKDAVMGALGDLGVHKADLMRWLLDDDFVEVSAFVSTLQKKSDVDDHGMILLKSKKGIMGQITASWVNRGPENNQTVITCTNGTIEIGTNPDYPVVVTYAHGAGRELHEVGAIASNTNQTGSGIMDAFHESITKKRKPEIDGNEGYASVATILTAMEAAKQRKTLKVK
ncbi:1,5-anhydro-D-fructose reductase [Poriferisphaera corsica]|uniref:1,5-anhydro-D-fructose reductase n=1 Tax=Poriferisphaera corsica TaxID=2528020 RepID=A0A517YUR1_9BACT|nr:Gfo/Idh/MocA family oxidoreductase [Poriferisphaera corsica]QDU33960.1 1,5-anhydro-D-fructose reductase [Poriferisphaera corsica]